MNRIPCRGRVATMYLCMCTAVALGGCAVDADKGRGAGEPSIAGKADFADRVSVKGALSFEDPSTGSFTEDLEYHGYTLLVSDGAVVDVEVTRAGTSRDLDTTLYVYGPRVGQSYQERAGFDDDDGYAKLSKIAELELSAGEYLVVVGTYSGLGRGNYRLAVSCASRDCQAVDPGVTGSCDERLKETIRECAHEWLAEGDFEDTRAEALEACLTDYGLDHYESACESPWSAPAEWCAAGRDSYLENTLPACRSALEPEFPTPLPSLSVIGRPGPDVSDLTGELCYPCGLVLEAFDVVAPTDGTDITFERVATTFQQSSRFGDSYMSQGPDREARLRGMLQSYSVVDVDALMARIDADAESTSPEVWQYSIEYYPAAGAQAWADLFVLWFADSRRAYTIELESGED